MKKTLILLALMSVTRLATAQDGNLDPSFNNNGLSIVKNAGGRGDLTTNMLITSNGKSIQVGNATTDSNTHYLLIRRNGNGTLDRKFGNDGIVLADFDGKDGNAYSAVELPDGKYMLAGNVLKGNFSKYSMTLMRFNKNGSVDSAFHTNGHALYSIGDGNDYPNALMLQPDGKLVAAGYTSYLGQDVFFAARILPDGSADTSFGNKGKTLIPFQSLTVFGNNATLQDDGKILITGSVQNADYEFDFATVRLNSDGTIDKTFGKNGKVITDFGGNNDFAYGIITQPDKKIIVAGYYSTGTKANAGIIRYNIDGSPDASFGNKGKVSGSASDANINCFSVALQPDNKIVAGATANYFSGAKSDYALFRFTTDGKIDSSFGTNGVVFTAVSKGFDGLTTVHVNSDGKILAAGNSQNNEGISKMSEARYLIIYQPSLKKTGIATKPLTIYPNPAKDYLFLKAEWNVNEQITVAIFDKEGNLMLKEKYTVTSKDFILKISLNKNWRPGNYFVTAEGNASSKSSFTIIK